jgi:glycosyltransferase involved in cell wall biosynthesis
VSAEGNGSDEAGASSFFPDPSAAGQAPDITVVIPTWNRGQRLHTTLESLAGQTLATDRYEVVVIDDGSVDDTSAVAERFARAHSQLDVRCLRQRNGGVNSARNAGIRAARAQIVSFLDDDESAPPRHLERIVQLLGAHPDVAGVGGPYREAAGTRLRTCAKCSVGAVQLPVTGTGETRRLLGGNMSLRRSAFDEVGMFDEVLSGRGDETEWFHRAGLRFLYVEDLFIWHRRDDFTRTELCRVQFRQGRALPLSAEKQGRPWEPSARRLLQRIGHALLRRCDQGLFLAAREIGAFTTWVLSRGRSPVNRNRTRRRRL